MDRLNRLLVSTPSEFAAAFDAAGDDCRTDATQTTAAFWLEGGITQAGAGFVWGKGEMSYRGCNHAFRLSGLSIADVDAANICANGSVIRWMRSLCVVRARGAASAKCWIARCSRGAAPPMLIDQYHRALRSN